MALVAALHNGQGDGHKKPAAQMGGTGALQMIHPRLCLSTATHPAGAMIGSGAGMGAKLALRTKGATERQH